MRGFFGNKGRSSREQRRSESETPASGDSVPSVGGRVQGAPAVKVRVIPEDAIQYVMLHREMNTINVTVYEPDMWLRRKEFPEVGNLVQFTVWGATYQGICGQVINLDSGHVTLNLMRLSS